MSNKEIKIGMFGGGGVGKTAITLRFLKDEFTEGYIPTIEDIFTKVVDVDNKTIDLQVIDTAGQDDFAEMRYSYYNQVQGYILVFDISQSSSVEELKNMHKDIVDAVDKEIYCIVAANKADFRDEGRSDLVPAEEYKKIESELKCKVIETSAKTGSNINELFTTLIKSIISPSAASSGKTTEKKETKKQNDGGSGGCCSIA